MEQPPLVTKALAFAAARGFARSCQAAAAAAFYADDPNVTILVGSWRDTLPPEAPFDLLFVDASDARDDVESTIVLLTPGGTAVLDDFWFDPSNPDQRRDAWLRHSLPTTIEVWVTPERRALVAVGR